jgi:YVTN family beta-propeller protein
MSSTAQNLLNTIAVGNSPVALAVNTTTNKIYVVNQGSNNATVIDGVTNDTTTVPVGATPDAVAINPLTNKIYVANCTGGSVTVVDGQTNGMATVAAGSCPYAVAVNSVTNKIYIANFDSNNVTVIDGATNQTSTVSVGYYPYAIAINSVTNKIFVADYGSNAITVIDGTTNSTCTVPVESYPHAVAVNQFTNQIYVANFLSNDVSVIDGTTYAVTSVPVGTNPTALAVDPILNEILVANIGSDTATVINGATLVTTTIAAGSSPFAVDLDPVTAKAYFANDVNQGTVTMLDEVSGLTSNVSVGSFPTAVAVNLVSDRIYAVNTLSNTVSVISGGSSNPLQFVPVPPCRVVDTRQPQGPYGGPYLSGGTSRNFAISLGGCNIPTAAAAYSLNVTVVPHTGSLGYLTIWPTAEPQPVVSTLNSPDGRVKANAAIVPAGASGAVTVYVTDATDVILDINGYFQSSGAQTLQFYSTPLCRIFDTRGPNGIFGGPYLYGGQERDFPILASNCQIPANALAYSMNLTVTPVDGQPLGYLTVWPAGSQQPVVSTLNNPTATILANAAIVPAGTGGAIAVYADQNTNLIGDINGYFALPGANGLSLYPLAPCRVIDTRSSGGAFSGQRKTPVDVAGSPCGMPATAQEYVFNATVVPIGSLGYLTLWADGDPMPGVSTLNATDGMVASNMAIIGNVDGATDAYAYGTTQLILDIASYFAP